MEAKKKIKILARRVVSDFWGTLQHINFDFTFKNGRTANLTHEVYGKSDGVALLLFNKDAKTVLLTRQFRMPMYVAGINDGFSYEVCGGSIDDGETPEESVIREAKEEIGYDVLNLQKVTTLFLSPGLVREQVYLYVGQFNNNCRVGLGGGVDDENEEVDVLEVTVDKALKMIDNNTIVDARTILLLQHIRLEFNC